MSGKKIKDTKKESLYKPPEEVIFTSSTKPRGESYFTPDDVKRMSSTATTSTSTNIVKSTKTTNSIKAGEKAGASITPPVSSLINDNYRKAIQRLNEAGLASDKRLVNLVIGNLGYANRLISLFINLKDLAMGLSDEDFVLLTNNVKLSGQLSNLLEVLQKVGVNPQQFNFSQLVRGATSSGQIQMGIAQLHEVGKVTKAPLNLMLQFPAFASDIADLKLNLRHHGYSMKPIAKSLSRIDETNISNALKILNLAIEAQAYSDRIVDDFLSSQEKLESVYSGAVKLANARLLTPAYFSMIQKQPENANRTAKMMILLNNSRVMPYFNDEDIKTLNGLNRTALFFMEQLENHGMLNSDNYSLLRDDNVILSNPELIDIIEGVRLYEQLTKDELDSIINIFKNVTSDPRHISECIFDLQDILNNHIFSKSP